MKKILGLIVCAVILCTMGAMGDPNEFYWADNLWTSDYNWETGFLPTTNDDVLIQQDLFEIYDYLDLDGTTGSGLSIRVGVEQLGVTNGTFGITNGSLVVGDGVFEIASDAGSDVSVELTNLTKTGFSTNLTVGTAAGATGTLTVANADVEAQGLRVATTVTNSVGTLTVSAGTVTIGGDNIGVATAAGAYGVASLAELNQVMNTSTGDLNVANSADSYGKLTASSGILSNDNVNVGNGAGSVGILEFGGTLITGSGNQIGGAAGASGSVSVVNYKLDGFDETKSLNVGAGDNSYGTMSITNLTLANKADLAMGAGSNSTAIVDVDTLTLESESGLTLGTGQDSTVILNYNTLVMPLLGDFTLGEGGTNYADLINTTNSRGRIGVTGVNLDISANDHDVTSVAINDGTIIKSGTATLTYTGGAADDDDILVGNIDGRSGSLVISTNNGWVAGSGNVSNDAIRVGNSVDATGTFYYDLGDIYAGFNGQSLNVGSGLNATGTAYIAGLQVSGGAANILVGNNDNAKGDWTVDSGNISNNLTRIGYSANTFGMLNFGAGVVHAPDANIQIAHHNDSVGIYTNLGTLTYGNGATDILVAGASPNSLGGYGVLYAANASFSGDNLLVARGVASTGIVHVATGTMTFDNSATIANALDSYAEITLPTLINTGANKDLTLATARNSYAKLTANGGTWANGDNFHLGNGSNSVGIANLGTMDLFFDNNCTFGSEDDASGTVSAASFSLITPDIDKTLAVADDLRTYGSMTLTGDLTIVGPGLVGVDALLADGTALNVGSANSAVGTVTADTAIFSNGIKQILIGSGANSKGTLDVNNIIIDGDVGRILIGTGNGSEVTFSGTMPDTGTGTLGDFQIGPNVSPAAADLINQFSVQTGLVSAGQAIEITRGDHYLTGVVNPGLITFSGTATANWIGGGALGVATVDGLTASLDLGVDYGASGPQTNFPIDVATGANSFGTLIYTNGSMFSQSNILDIANNTSGANATGTVVFSEWNHVGNNPIIIGRGTNTVGSLTVSNGVVEATNLNVADWNNTNGVNNKATFTMVSGTFSNVGSVNVAQNVGGEGTLSLDVWNKSNAGGDVNIAGGNNDAINSFGGGAQGIVTVNSGTVIGDNLNVGTHNGSFGKLDMGTGSLDFDNTSHIGLGTSSSGIVEAASLVYQGGSTKYNTIGGGTNSYGRLTVGDMLMNSHLRVGNNDGGLGVLEVSGTIINTNASGRSIHVANLAGSTGTATIGTLIGGTLRVGNASNTVGTATIGTLVTTNGGTVAVAEVDYATGTLNVSNWVLDATADLRLASGNNSDGTLNVTVPIVLSNTNGLFIGTGIGSTASIGSTDISFTGPIGSFGVGDGTDAATIDLFSQNDTYGVIEYNKSFGLTNGTHWITGLIKNGGTVTVTPPASSIWVGGDEIAVATLTGADATLDLGVEWGLGGAVTAGVVNVARANNAVGSLVYTNGGLVATGTIEVGSGGENSEGTVLLSSLYQYTNDAPALSVCNTDLLLPSTGTVTVLGDAEVHTFRIAQGHHSVGTVDVGGTLTMRNYFNIGRGSNSVGSVTVGTLMKTNSYTTLQMADEVDSINADATLIASDGTVYANAVLLAGGEDSTALVAVTNGTLKGNGNVRIAYGTDTTAKLLIGTLYRTGGANTHEIGTGTNAVGELEIATADINSGNLIIGNDVGTGTVSVVDGAMKYKSLSMGAGSTLALTDPVLTVTTNIVSDITALVGNSSITGSGTTTEVETNGWSTVLFSGNLVWGLDTNGNTIVWSGLAKAGSVATPFEDWADGFGLTGGDAAPGFDADGDALANVAEYGVGGKPNDPNDTGFAPVTSLVEDTGTNWLMYIYTVRNDDPALSSFIELTDDLVSGVWSNNTSLYEVLDTVDLGNDFNSVTNRIIIEDTEDGINARLRIELTE